MKKRYCPTQRSDSNQLIRAAYDLAHAIVFALAVIVMIFMFVFPLFTTDSVSVITGISNEIHTKDLAVYTNADGQFELVQILGEENQSVSVNTQSKEILVNHQKTAVYKNDETVRTLPKEEFTLSGQYLVAKLSVTGKEEQAAEYFVVDKNRLSGAVKAIVFPAEQFKVF